MRVEQLTREAQERRRQEAKETVEPAFSAIYVGDKVVFHKVVLVIRDFFLAGAETQFEAAQTFIGDRRPAQVQPLVSVGSIPFDGFPHEKVVGTQVLKRVIGGSELVKSMPAMVKED